MSMELVRVILADGTEVTIKPGDQIDLGHVGLIQYHDPEKARIVRLEDVIRHRETHRLIAFTEERVRKELAEKDREYQG